MSLDGGGKGGFERSTGTDSSLVGGGVVGEVIGEVVGEVRAWLLGLIFRDGRTRKSDSLETFFS